MGIRVILILVALATAAGATVVAMAGAGTASGRSSARVFTLLAPPGGTSTAIDLGKHGMSPGDEFLTTDSPLRNPTSHRRVGRADIIETAMSESRSRLSVSVQVESGTLEVARVLDPRRRSSTLPVVGGTGVYAGASGIVRFKPKGGGGTLTFRLLG